MFQVKKWIADLLGAGRKVSIKNDIDEELAFHLEMCIQEHVERGMPIEKAREEALKRFGNVGQITDMCGEIREGGIERGVSRDFFYCIRMLSNRPLFSIALIIILAIGIGANIIAFSISNAVLIRPLPYENPERLVILAETSPQLDNMSVSFLNYLDWKNQNQVFEQIGAYREQDFNLNDLPDPEFLHGRAVSSNLFSILGVKPILGGDFFSPQEQQKALPAILSYSLWQRRFSGDPAVLGKNLRLNETDFVVCGVLPLEFKLFDDAEVFTLLEPRAEEMENRNAHSGIYLVARLKTGVTLDEARAEMNGIAKVVERQYPETNAGNSVKIVTLNEYVYKRVQPMLLIQLSGVALTLLVITIFIGNLLLAKSTERKKIIAIRKAMGISRRRIFKQILIEGTILSFAGGVLGLVLSLLWQNKTKLAFPPDVILRFYEVTTDGRVLAFSLLISVVVGLSLALAPGLYAFKLFKFSAFGDREDDREAVAPLLSAHRRIRNFLLISQVALAITLLFISGLIIRVFQHLRNEPVGFNPQNVATMQLSISPLSYGEERIFTDFYQRILREIRTLPEVESIAATSGLPLIQASETTFAVDSQAQDARRYEVTHSEVSPQYHQTLAIPLIKGRFFTEDDVKESRQVMIVDENINREIFPGENSIGRYLTLQGELSPHEIIGVVGHVKQYKHDDSNDLPFQIYTPLFRLHSKDLFLLARTTNSVDPKALTDDVRGAIWKINRNQPVSDFKTMDQILGDSVARERSNAILLAVCAFISVLLAIVGVSSAVFHTVTPRKSKLDLNVFHAALQRERLKLIAKQGDLLIFIGSAIGLAMALIIVKAVPSFFHRIVFADLISALGITLLFIPVLLGACHISARRAAKLSFRGMIG